MDKANGVNERNRKFHWIVFAHIYSGKVFMKHCVRESAGLCKAWSGSDFALTRNREEALGYRYKRDAVKANQLFLESKGFVHGVERRGEDDVVSVTQLSS